MTRNASLVTINCTECGAGLDVLGGGRVQTHVCGYCGSQLDAQDDYKVLQKFAGLKRPESPLQIGMTGQIYGVDYTVIGTLGFEERYGGQVWRWVDHQLFSSTHGYAFLTVEKGHFIFSRAYRKATSPRWISSAMVEQMDSPPSVTSPAGRHRYYDTSTATIKFAEGEFNWAPRIGDISQTVSLMGTSTVLAFSRTRTEEEIIRSSYPDPKEIADSFGLEWLPALHGIHRLQPYNAGEHDTFIRKVAGIAAVVCSVLYLALLAIGGGTQTAQTNLSAGDFPVTVPFEISQANRVAKLAISGDFNNSWTYFDIGITGPDGETVFETGRTISYYSGRDADGNWSEGSRQSTLRFRPNATGTYMLDIEVGETESTRAFSALNLKVSEGALVARWFLFAALFFGLVWVVPTFRWARHQRARWAGMDWNEE